MIEQLEMYFSDTKGTGVLATADAEGRVNAAVYATPHFLDDGTVGFIMPDRLTHRNLTANPSAVYLFIEAAEGYHGKRVYLDRVGEEKDTERLYALRRRDVGGDESPRYLVRFTVENVLPLIGAGDDD